jgi:hypothetical protein
MKMISDGAVSSREITTNLNSRINRRELLLFQPCDESVKLCSSEKDDRGVTKSGTCSFQAYESRRDSAVWTLGPPSGGPCL